MCLNCLLEKLNRLWSIIITLLWKTLCILLNTSLTGLYKYNWLHKQTHNLSFTCTLDIGLYNLLMVTNPVGFDRRWDSPPRFSSFSASCGLAAQFGMKTSRGSGQPWEVCVCMFVSVLCVCNTPSFSSWPKQFVLWSSGCFKILHLCRVKKSSVLPAVTSLAKDNLQNEQSWWGLEHHVIYSESHEAMHFLVFLRKAVTVNTTDRQSLDPFLPSINMFHIWVASGLFCLFVFCGIAYTT